MKNNTEDTSSQEMKDPTEKENNANNNKKSGKRFLRDLLWFVAGAAVGCGGTLLYNKSCSGKGTEPKPQQTQSPQYNNSGNNRPFNGNNGQR